LRASPFFSSLPCPTYSLRHEVVAKKKGKERWDKGKEKREECLTFPPAPITRWSREREVSPDPRVCMLGI